MALRAIIFDLDETLMYEQRSVDETFLAVCAMAEGEHGIEAEALYRTVLGRAREIWHVAPMREYCVSVGVSSWEGLSGPFTSDNPNEVALAEWTPGYRLQAWTNGLADHGIDDPGLAQEMATAFCAEREKRHFLFDETITVLDALRGEYRFAMLTNGAPSVQRAKISATALAPYFEAIIVTGDVGVGKPHRRVFDVILGELGLGADEAVMVGDSLKNDIEGAKNVGMRSVWLNRWGKRLNGEAMPDWELPDLRGLASVLAGHES